MTTGGNDGNDCAQIDVESHEGHVLAGADRLFYELDIPLVWMEWEHVKKREAFGAQFIFSFMRRHGMHAFNIMSGSRLKEDNFKKWPFTVLWRKDKTPDVLQA